MPFQERLFGPIARVLGPLVCLVKLIHCRLGSLGYLRLGYIGLGLVVVFIRNSLYLFPRFPLIFRALHTVLDSHKM